MNTKQLELLDKCHQYCNWTFDKVGNRIPVPYNAGRTQSYDTPHLASDKSAAQMLFDSVQQNIQGLQALYAVFGVTMLVLATLSVTAPNQSEHRQWQIAGGLIAAVLGATTMIASSYLSPVSLWVVVAAVVVHLLAALTIYVAVNAIKHWFTRKSLASAPST